MSGHALEEFLGLKPKMYLILQSDSSEYEKAKVVNKNVVAKISHNEHKGVLLNKNCLAFSMHRIKSKNHRIRTLKSKKNSKVEFKINKFLI